MKATIDELTIAYSEDGFEKVKELDKQLLSKGAWTTIMFRYQEWNAKKDCYGPDKYSIRRFKKENDQYWLKSKFNISSADQANKIVSILNQWIA